MRKLWCLWCYWAVTRWPFSCYNRLAWPVYLWLIQYAGEHAYRGEEVSE